MYIFLSHSSTNANIAETLCSHIESNGHRCFIAPRDIRTGFEYAAEIMNGLDKSDAMILILSNASANSPHVLREIERAVSKSIPIIVYKLEDVVLSKSLEYFLMTHQWMNEKNDNYDEIINSINTLQAATVQESSIINNGNNTATNTVTSVVTNTEANNTLLPPASNPKNQRRRFILPAVIFISAIIISISILIGTFILKDNGDNKETDSTSEMIQGDNSTTSIDSTNDDTTSNSENDETSDTEFTTDEIVTDDTDDETTSNNSSESVKVNIGDTITFGKYNNCDIKWRVLRLSEDGKEAILITDSIITIKGYDAADTGQYGYYNGESQYSSDSLANTDMDIQAQVRGNSSWELSSIRTWLNSSSKLTKYENHIPNASSFADNVNAYNDEPGFLYNFTEEERSAIIEKEITTKANILVDSETITTKDKVFLLSLEELEWFKDTTISLYAKPTEAALAANEGTWYKDYCLDTYHTEYLMWWLREPVDGCSSKCYMVNVEIAENTTTDFYTVGVEEFGIRPAITVDLTSPIFKNSQE